MEKVAILEVDEEINVDGRRIGEIVAELGETAAQSLLVSALEHLAEAFRQTMRAAEAGDFAQAVSHLDRLSRLAWQVGLVSLAGVAIDVGRCAETGDMAGFAATLARLSRVVNRSLTEIWDHDLDAEE
ncbi:hypothetical protein [Paracoccus aminophilus]|uniref:HPt domain-containing protein n=1 Tax=Paracoccus aminophilus JCM 7686 TaxID=1367847 RepID=S5XS66_PARAH|nr:hypothetical protein [Paracoccus aminophilus]AGT10299.1 hypothetical protein JCM7686_3264 [Paracoccus aminophilus JCM 7686]